MKNVELRPMSLVDAKEVCSWKYPPPYDSYNYLPFEVGVREGWAIAVEEKRKQEFTSVYRGLNLLGYFRFYEEGGDLFLGLGLRPDMTGKGLGRSFMEIVLDKFKKDFKDRPLFLKVRDFNQRAYRLYRNVGFEELERKEETLAGKSFIMIKMVYRP